MLLYPTLLELHLLTEKQVILTGFFMQNKVTAAMLSFIQVCLALHFGVQGYSDYTGHGKVAEQKQTM